MSTTTIRSHIRVTATAALLLLGCLLPAAPPTARADEDAEVSGPPKVALADFFAGTVVEQDGRYVELSYDFSDVRQLTDFQASLAFRAIQSVAYKIERGKIRLTGTGSMRHKAVFQEKVAAAAAFTPQKNRDFGFCVSEQRESEIFTLYCVYDKYFSAGDGVFTPQNMIVKFIARDPKMDKDGMQEWRYCGSRGPKPEIKRRKTYQVSMAREGLKSQMKIDNDFKAKGKETGRDLTTMMLAVYGHTTDVVFDNLIVKGMLDAKFVEENNLATPKKPKRKPEPEVVEGAAEVPTDEAGRIEARIAGYPKHTSARDLSKLLRDAKIPTELRAKAADRAVEVGSKKLVPFLVQGLYDTKVDTRRVCMQAFEGLVGKSFGYRADAADKARSSAMKKINAYIKKNAAKFQ